MDIGSASLTLCVQDDLLQVQDTFGSDLIYVKLAEGLVAIQLNDEGDEIARYHVDVQLTRL